MAKPCELFQEGEYVCFDRGGKKWYELEFIKDIELLDKGPFEVLAVVDAPADTKHLHSQVILIKLHGRIPLRFNGDWLTHPQTQ